MRRTPVSREFWQDLLATGYRSSMTFAVACLLLVVVFALGGSSRGDVFALLFLRPAAIVALGCGLWTLRPAHIAAHRFLFAFAIASLAITLVHLGVDLAGVTTRTTMAKGLQLAFARLGLEVTRRAEGVLPDLGLGKPAL